MIGLGCPLVIRLGHQSYERGHFQRRLREGEKMFSILSTGQCPREEEGVSGKQCTHVQAALCSICLWLQLLLADLSLQLPGHCKVDVVAVTVQGSSGLRCSTETT